MLSNSSWQRLTQFINLFKVSHLQSDTKFLIKTMTHYKRAINYHLKTLFSFRSHFQKTPYKTREISIIPNSHFAITTSSELARHFVIFFFIFSLVFVFGFVCLFVFLLRIEFVFCCSKRWSFSKC